ncbi:MAG: stage 0 sporulation family protein [Proteobacteria bacterium]|nr:stage 0 sporulation family protein [Pseudomonadota bacterium]MBU1389396.1 stage 0 sporulation family protein [Pseudomonadota bacterium]MBU1541216.1 stage 0 sporulation family protein [Pseudomonadota bacterium]MBU2430055.1 stage 0 sporulation family protein [Pseudomonadota bacterium]MBU2479641.1 stage 0 sporulation family protein [Pseudomonadota bacterium]
MIKVAGVKFKTAGKIYDFKSCAFVLKEGDPVIVETEQGLGFGRVAIPPVEVENVQKELKQIVRMATKDDFIRRDEIKKLENDAFDFCLKSINALDLFMNLFSVESTFDKNKLTFFYTADGRIDFRELIKLLIKEFSVRIEMRQVGIRNLSKHCGGIGKCGRELCCSSFMHTFDPVSIKMAKEQGLSLNPTKISGVCGRLMCCLTFENETYKSLKRDMPKIGKKVSFKDGTGKVVRQNVLRQSVSIRLDDNTEVEKKIQELVN